MFLPRRVGLSVALIVGIALALLVLRTFSPQQFGFYPQCAFHRFTGLNCPGCGGTRCLHALLNGRVLDALHDNVLIVLFLPVFLVGALRYWWPWLRGLPKPAPIAMKSRLIYFIALMVIAFAVLRNLPWAPFTYLSPA